MTVKIKYHEETKLKKNNPFLKMRDADRNTLREHILKIVFYIAETHTNDLEVYNAYTHPDNAHKSFGKSSQRGKPNTALAALTGAAEKLGRGDLSRQQLENISTILDWAATNIPGTSAVIFEDIGAPKSTTPYELLFEAQR